MIEKTLTKNSNITNTNQMLWKSFKKGNKQAFSQIFKTYYNDLYYYGIKLIQQEDMVKDELQELFIELWDRRKNLGDITHIKAYLIKSFRRKLLKSKDKARKEVIKANEFVDTTVFEISIEELIIQGEVFQMDKKKLKKVLTNLNKTQKEIIYLKFYNDLDYKDIASITGIKYQSVRNSMHKALKAMREGF